MISGRLGAATLAAGACLALVGCGQALAAESGVMLEGPDRQPVAWGDWLRANGPTAVLLWASWAPQSERALPRLEDLSSACRSAGIGLLVVAVQEPFADAEAVLGSRSVAWLHDRHGALLKLHRVLKLPSLLVVEPDGSVAARLEPTPEAIRAWSPP